MSYGASQSVLENRRRRGLGLRLCYNCKTERHIQEFRKDSSASTGYGYICRVCTAKKRGWPTLTKEQRSQYNRSHSRTIGGRFTHAKVCAKRRGLSWGISKEEYAKLIALPCAYCDGPLSETGVALDRKDSALGYESFNVVQCCTECNVAKSDHFSYDEMMATLGPAIKYIRKCRAERMR